MRRIVSFGKGLVNFLKMVMVAAVCLAAVLPSAQAQEYASKARTKAAAGYYARARAMLVEALAEFEQGRKTAQPDLLVDPEEWRLTLISLTEQLNRLVDPKARVTADGVVFNANPRMIRREHDRVPPVADGAKDSNAYGEQDRMRSKEASRVKTYGAKDDKKSQTAAKTQQTEPVVEEQSEPQEAEARVSLPEPKQQSKEEKEEAASPVDSADEERMVAPSKEPIPETVVEQQQSSPVQETPGASKAVAPADEEAAAPGEDEKMTAAIEQAVRQRLESLKTESANEDGGGAKSLNEESSTTTSTKKSVSLGEDEESEQLN